VFPLIDIKVKKFFRGHYAGHLGSAVSTQSLHKLFSSQSPRALTDVDAKSP
jgi:hypothetical protein